VAFNIRKAIKYYKLSALQNNSRAMNNLAVCYQYQKKNEKAFRLFQTAAWRGQLESIHNLAKLYEIGDGIPTNFPEALILYKMAAEKGYAASQNRMGFFYESGVFVSEEESESKAFYWYKRAATEQDPCKYIPGLFNLARCYLNGIGTDINIPVAVQFFEKASILGLEEANKIVKILKTIWPME
jgi:TPR repeat protein